jgi:hypothetical protein
MSNTSGSPNVKNKKKRKLDGALEINGLASQTETVNVEPESKQTGRKKATMDTPGEVSTSSERKGKGKVGRRQTEEDKEANTPTKGEKKHKRRKDKTEAEDCNDGSIEPRRKRRKMVDDFVNPEQDSTLTDQARKGMRLINSVLYSVSD